MVRREIVARQLRIRLGRGKRVGALIHRLPLCTNESLDRLVDLLAGAKEKEQLLTTIERLLPKDPEAS